jgi:hypothetical protein
LIATAHQVDGLFVLHRAPESTKYTNIHNDSYLLALTMSGHAYRHDAEKRILWFRCLVHFGLNALKI